MRPWLHAILLALLPLALQPAAIAHATVPIALFKTAEIRAPSHEGLRQWQAVLERLDHEWAIYEACGSDAATCPDPAVANWLATLAELEGLPLDEQVVRINRFVNQWRYRSDMAVYGRSDYWATPIQFFTNSGDCEDYAIAKYVSLRLLRVPDDQLRLAVVHDVVRDLAHAVLVVYLDGTAVVLDNLTNAVLPHDRIAHYAPYYTVNETTRWAHVPSGHLVTSAIAQRVTTAADR